MRLIKFATDDEFEMAWCRVGLLEGDQVIPLHSGPDALSRVLHAEDPEEAVRGHLYVRRASLPLAEVRVLPPIDVQEVWGAGVTYERSKVAREEESEPAPRRSTTWSIAPSRPELFFKATPSRVVGPGAADPGPARLEVVVPEPELALVLTPVAEARRLHGRQRRQRPRHRGREPALSPAGEGLRRARARSARRSPWPSAMPPRQSSRRSAWRSTAAAATIFSGRDDASPGWPGSSRT